MKTETINGELFFRLSGKSVPATKACTEACCLALEREQAVVYLKTVLDDAKTEHMRALLTGEVTDRSAATEIQARLDAAIDALDAATRTVADIEQAIDRHRAEQIDRQASVELAATLKPFNLR